MQEQGNNRNSVLLAALAEIQKLQESEDSAPNSDEMRILKSLAKDLQGDFSDSETEKSTQCWVGDPQADEEFDLLCLSELKLKARQLSRIDFSSASSLGDSLTQLDQLLARHQEKNASNHAIQRHEEEQDRSGVKKSPSSRQTRDEKIKELRELIKNSPILARVPPNLPPPKPPLVCETTSLKGVSLGERSQLARPGPRPKKPIPAPLPVTTAPTITRISPKASPIEEEQPDEEFEALRNILPADFDLSRLTKVFDKHFNNDVEEDEGHLFPNSTPSTTVASPRSATSYSSSNSSTPTSGSVISGINTATQTEDEDTLTSNSDISPFSSLPRSKKNNNPMNTIARKTKISEVVGSWAGDNTSKEPPLTREEKIAQVVNIWKKNRTTSPPTVDNAGSGNTKETKITEVVSAWLKGTGGESGAKSSISKALSSKGSSSGHHHHHLKLFSSSKDKKDKKEKKEKKDKKEKKEKKGSHTSVSSQPVNHNSVNSSMLSSLTNAPIDDKKKARWSQVH